MMTVTGPIKCLRCGYSTPSKDYQEANGQIMEHLRTTHPNWVGDGAKVLPTTPWKSLAESRKAAIEKFLADYDDNRTDVTTILGELRAALADFEAQRG